MKSIMINRYIIADPKIAHGKPVFKGTRIMVWQVLEMFSQNQNEEEVLEAFPSLKPAHLKAALEYASSITKQNYAFLNTPGPIFA